MVAQGSRWSSRGPAWPGPGGRAGHDADLRQALPWAPTAWERERGRNGSVLRHLQPRLGAAGPRDARARTASPAQGLVSLHILGWRHWDGWDGGVEDLSCRWRTGQRGRHDVPAAPACAGAQHAGAGPGPHGVGPEPVQHLPIRTSAASTR
jgi:hypothetical protein